MNVAFYYGLGLNVHPAACLNCALEAPCNEDAVTYDLTLDHRMLAEDQRAFGNQRPFHRGVNPKGARGFELALQLDPPLEKSGPFRGFLLFMFEPSPRHAAPLCLGAFILA